MGNLTAFLAQNAKQVENVKLVVSDRFTDEDGKPLEWEVRCITSREDETLRRDCQYRVQVPGKRGSFRQISIHAPAKGATAKITKTIPNDFGKINNYNNSFA